MNRELAALLADVSQPQRRASGVALWCAAAAAMAGISLLGLAGWFITAAALAGAAGIAAIQAFNYLIPGAAIRLLAIVRTVTRYGERLYGHKAALFALAALRARLFGRLINAPSPEHTRSAGETGALLQQDVDALEDRFVRAPAYFAGMFGAATALALAVPAGPRAFLALFVIMAAGVLAARSFARRVLPRRALDIQEQIARLKQEFVEYAAASPEIAAYGFAPSIEALLARQAARLDDARVGFARNEALLGAGVTALGGLAIATMIALSRASLPLTLLAALAAAGALEALGATIRSLGRDAVVAAGLERLAQLAAIPGPTAAPVPLIGESIALGDDPRSVMLAKGDRLAITGRSGAGKTSLLECLAGWRTTCGHSLLIDQRPLAECPPEARRRLFALSPQDGGMIAGTIADNLRLARPGLEDEALWHALGIACLADDVRVMPERLLTWIGDGGARLSGGQRKRLSLARALLAGRPWLLLDEPSEGLDPATEAVLCGNLDSWLRDTGTGLVLVTHRSAMLPLAHRFLELPD
ncbi:ATP-binding cassette domain-containing protein [Sphingobium indicum]